MTLLSESVTLNSKINLNTISVSALGTEKAILILVCLHFVRCTDDSCVLLRNRKSVVYPKSLYWTTYMDKITAFIIRLSKPLGITVESSGH